MAPDSGGPPSHWDALVSRAAGMSKDSEALSNSLKETGTVRKAITSKLLSDSPPPAPEMPALPPPPPPFEGKNPLQAFGSLASVLGIFGGMLTRKPLETSLKAATGAMTAARQNDIENYNLNYQQWKSQTEYATKLQEFQLGRYRAAVDQYKNDHDSLMGALTALGASDQNAALLHQIQTGDLSLVMQALDHQESAIKAFRDLNLRLDELGEKTRHDLEIEKRQPGGATGGWTVLTDPKNQQQYRYHMLTGEATTLSGEPYTPSGAAKLAGGTPRSAPAMFLQKYMQENPEASAEQIANAAAGYQARVKAVVDMAAGKGAATIRSFDVASQHLDTLDNLADALKNGDTKAFNAAANAWSKQFGGPAPTNFETARTIIGNEVVKAIIGAAGTGEDRAKAQAAFDAAYGPEVIHGATDTVRALIRGQMIGLEKQYVDTTGKTAEDFRQRLTPAALKMLDNQEKSASSGHKEGDKAKSKSGKPMIFRNGQWEYE